MTENNSLFWEYGVYALTFPEFDKFYVGITGYNFYNRYCSHLNQLKNHKHGNKELQTAFQQFGPDLIMIVLETGLKYGPLKTAEKKWIKKLPTVKQNYGGKGGYSKPKKHLFSILKNTVTNTQYVFQGGIDEQLQLKDKLSHKCMPITKLQQDWDTYGESNFVFSICKPTNIEEFLFNIKICNSYNRQPIIPHIHFPIYQYEYT